jgi:hypothetical protein
MSLDDSFPSHRIVPSRLGRGRRGWRPFHANVDCQRRLIDGEFDDKSAFADEADLTNLLIHA